MAGSSRVTLFRSDDSTIDMDFLGKQAARTLAAQLDVGTLQLRLFGDPGDQLYLTISAVGLAVATVSGCTLNAIDAPNGKARLYIPATFWTGKTQSRFRVEATFIDTDAVPNRFGSQTFDVTE